jgi:putative membrane protein
MSQQFRVRLAVAAALAVMATGYDAAAQSAKGSVNGGDRKFMEKAAMDNMAEVQMGQMAQQKTQNPQVKDFAGRMVQDHTKASDELKQLASSKGVSLPAEVDREHKKHGDELQKKSADKFDHEYMEHMVKEHKKDVKEFEKQAKSAKDPDVKAFAQKTLPTLQAHLQAAQATYDSTKGKGKPAAK